MKNVEIERKFLVRKDDMPKDLYKYKFLDISQGFIYLKPAIRIRKSNDDYYLTVKSAPPKSLKLVKDDMARTEFEIPISKKAYNDLLKMCCGRIVYKRRYLIPYKKHIIELDIFEKELKGLIYAEVEFKSLRDAEKFIAPDWFFKDVTGIEKYKNTQLSVCKNIKNLIKY